ncbi:MAG: hypothetical protein FRX49_09285 [Trebouxia sp. A1-2]|nr:MAG: hypothetical protein FRX49_09285 [Trebouxia sp. A1-2]
MLCTLPDPYPSKPLLATLPLEIMPVLMRGQWGGPPGGCPLGCHRQPLREYLDLLLLWDDLFFLVLGLPHAKASLRRGTAASGRASCHTLASQAKHHNTRRQALWLVANQASHVLEQPYGKADDGVMTRNCLTCQGRNSCLHGGHLISAEALGDRVEGGVLQGMLSVKQLAGQPPAGAPSSTPRACEAPVYHWGPGVSSRYSEAGLASGQCSVVRLTHKGSGGLGGKARSPLRHHGTHWIL